MRLMTAPEQPDPSPATWVDTHAHVFDAGVSVLANPRYVPAYSATLDDWLALMDTHSVTHGVLVQPSFLDTDNRLMLSALAAHQQRLRGVAVLAPAQVTASHLAELWAQGVRGLRLNLMGRSADHSTTQADTMARALAAHAGAKAWHLELHHEADALGACVAAAADVLRDSRVGLVVDHFGRPGALGVNCPSQTAVRRAAERCEVWVKCSAPYRCRAEVLPAVATALWRDLGPERLLWGSDWPWTQHETGRSYRDAQTSTLALAPDPSATQRAWAAAAWQVFFAGD